MSSSDNPPAPNNYGPRRLGDFRGDQNQYQKYTPNDQELRVLKECQNESFWYRALPLGLMAGTGVYALIQRGILTTRTRFGPFPKVFFASICGYVIGKVSYLSTCKKKFLTLGNSPIADMIRTGTSPGAVAAQFRRPMEGMGFGEGASDALFTGGGAGRAHDDDYNSEDSSIDTSLDQDISMESYDHSGVGGAPLLSGPTDSAAKPKPEMTMTYDELRKRNREKASLQQYREVSPALRPPRLGESAAPKPPASSRPDDGFTLGRASKLRKNVYGDEISDD